MVANMSQMVWAHKVAFRGLLRPVFLCSGMMFGGVVGIGAGIWQGGEGINGQIDWAIAACIEECGVLLLAGAIGSTAACVLGKALGGHSKLVTYSDLFGPLSVLYSWLVMLVACMTTIRMVGRPWSVFVEPGVPAVVLWVSLGAALKAGVKMMIRFFWPGRASAGAR